MLSNGVSLKTHLQSYGSTGFSAIFDCLGTSAFDQCAQPLSKLLTWREREVEVVRAPVYTWECRWCKERKEEKDQKYEKMDFVYCSMKCLGAHRVAGFK